MLGYSEKSGAFRHFVIDAENGKVRSMASGSDVSWEGG